METIKTVLQVQEKVTLKEVKDHIRNIPDYPKPGIQFKDITTVLKEKKYFDFILRQLYRLYQDKGITKVVALEARGFIFGGALAAMLGAGFVPIRKPGKLPAEKNRINYQLEYGEDAIEIHKDALSPDDVILLHDDLLATGGTSKAAIQLLEMSFPSRIFLNFIIELDYLHGREKIKNYEITSLIHY